MAFSVNEWEDLATFQTGRLRYDLPQKLSTLDTVVIYFRRHLAMRSRDFQRLGGTYGSNHPPTRAGAKSEAEESNEPAVVGPVVVGSVVVGPVVVGVED